MYDWQEVPFDINITKNKKVDFADLLQVVRVGERLLSASNHHKYLDGSDPI